MLKLILGSGIAYYLYNRGMEASDKITWQLRPVRLQDVRLLKAEFDIRIDISNGTSLPIKLLGYTGFVKRGGATVGQINAQGEINLPANGATTIEAVVKLQKSALEQLNSLLQGNGLLVPIEVDSYLRTSLMDVPVKRTIEFLKVS